MEENKEPIIIEMQGSELTEMISINTICRLCANQNDKLISIYSEEGVNNDLANKMNLYLPVKVSETDELPLQCCWQCASTVLAWHELVITSVEADRRLRSYQFVIGGNIQISFPTAETVHTEKLEEVEPVNAGLNAYCQSDTISQKSKKDLIKSIVPDFTTHQGDTLNDFINIPQQYFQLNSDLYDIKIDDKMTIEDQPLEETAPDDTEDSLNDKVSRNQRMCKFSCPCCCCLFSSVRETELHIKKSHPEVKSASLELLEEPLGNVKDEKQKNSILEDILTATKVPEVVDKEELSEEDRIYKLACPYCYYASSAEDEIVTHIAKVHPEGVVKPQPPVVKEKSTENVKKEKRKSHKIDQEMVNAAKVVVDGRIYYNCKECGKSLHSPYTYMWHMRIHTGERPYICDLCGKQFRVSQGLVRHLKETHARIKNFPCDLCGRMFATRRNVEEHRRIHTNERPYICDLCGKSFKQKASLFVHNRSHNDSFPFKCSYCNQAFRTKPPMLLHVTKHTGEKPYACDVCGRCFRIKYELKRHRLIHSDDKPFSCSVCGLSFRQKRYLRNHNKLNHHTQ